MIRVLREFKENRGFTLVELMIVVAIVGLLASVALPVFETYIKKTREAGYPLFFSRIERGERSFWEKPRIKADGTELPPCLIQVLFHCFPFVMGREPDDWDLSCSHPQVPSMLALSLEGIKTHMAYGWTDAPTLGGQGMICNTLDEDPSAFDDVSSFTMTFMADSDGDGVLAWIDAHYVFTPSGDTWTFFWNKQDPKIY